MNHIATAMDRMIADQEHRHSWLFAAGEQIRRWNEEDRKQEDTGGISEASVKRG